MVKKSAKKTWKEKLEDSKDMPKVVKIDKKLQKSWGKGTVVIPTPKEVDKLMAKVPKGKVTTINDIRSKLAKKHKATIGCPICTGIFSNIAAKAAEEDLAAGKKKVTPYWRTLKVKGELNPKYPGGVAKQAKKLRDEKHKLIMKYKVPRVEDYEKKLAKL
ncbi:hypothetical protein ACFL24_01455 [Patescibacteria group bacterium]